MIGLVCVKKDYSVGDMGWAWKLTGGRVQDTWAFENIIAFGDCFLV